MTFSLSQKSSQLFVTYRDSVGQSVWIKFPGRFLKSKETLSFISLQLPKPPNAREMFIIKTSSVNL